METSTMPSLLETHTPAAVVTLLKGLEDATEKLLELIKSTKHKDLKKLKTVFTEIDNYDEEKIYELASSPNRVDRYSITYVVLSKIKLLCKKKAGFEKIERMYDNVFAVRFRDVDPLIRAMAVQFLSEFAYENAVLRKMPYLVYLGWALNDKSDSVRRRAVKGVARLAQILKGKGKGPGGDVEKFIGKYKARIVEMACFDVNSNIQRACSNLVLDIFCNTGICTEEEALTVLVHDKGEAEMNRLAMASIFPDNVRDIDRMHEIYAKTGPGIFKYFQIADDSAFEALVMEICTNIYNNTVCCDKGGSCMLDIIKPICPGRSPSSLLAILKTTKDSEINTAKAVGCLINVGSYEEHAAVVHEAVELLRDRSQKSTLLAECFSDFLKCLEEDFPITVGDEVRELAKSREAYLAVVRNFDVSNALPPGYTSLEACYTALWLIAKEEYARLAEFEFVDSESQSSLIDFLVLFYNNSHAEGVFLDPLEEAADAPSAFRRLAARLSIALSSQLSIKTEEDCLNLFKLLDLGLFTEHSEALFEKCSLETLSQLISISKKPKLFVEGFLKAVSVDKRLSCLSKAVAARVSKHDSDRYLFRLIKELVVQHKLLDTVLVNFVSALTPNECIVLENMAVKSRFKVLCARASKADNLKKSIESVTVI